MAMIYFVIDNRSWIDSMQKQSQVSDSKRRKVTAANMSSVKFEEIDAGASTGTRNKALKNIKREKSLKACVSTGCRKLNFNGESGMKIKKFKYENDAKDLIKKKIKKSIGKGSKAKHNVARYVKWRGIKTRSSPHQLNRCIAGLKEKQKLKIIEMGFGNLLSFKVDGIPAKLGNKDR
ncbi:uncharacterized protein LOC143584925 [Bidens hawaiensis]|uniref:uncharacterized protein LOC143584925 n=1 Tax=Bidens hawaiensis TaxID=980011 RepID=UPI004049F23A